MSTLTFVALVALVAVATACGGRAEPALAGIVRDDPLRSSGVTVTDVTDAGAHPAKSDRFELVARPGGLLIVMFGYTSCPDICPTSLAEIKTALRRLGDDAERVDVAMITVDPERDTAAILNAYAGSFVDRYHVLRPSTIAELETAQDAFLASSSITTTAEGRVEVGHSTSIYVVDTSGTVVVEWPFGLGVEAVQNDLRVLLDRVKI